MKIQSDPELHLTYCLNIHPGETLQDVIGAIKGPASRVKSQVCSGGPFGLGLRLSAGAVMNSGPSDLAELRDAVKEAGMYVFTVNGFPYGSFHGTRVKENVYSPDWRTDERRVYTERLAALLAELLPEGVEGSISTVPVSYRPWIESEKDLDRAVLQLVRMVMTCIRLDEAMGRKVSIALEPEPDCYVQNMDGAIAFFNDHLLLRGAKLLAGETGMPEPDSEAAIRSYAGICFDTCHAAVQFEDPVDGLGRLALEGISVPKIQVSSAIRAVLSHESRANLRKFIDPVYFHQTRVMGADGRVGEFTDLDAALLDSLRDGAEIRTHFHVPLWFSAEGGLEGTAAGLSDEFFRMVKSGISAHVEAETYTFGVLPEKMRNMDVVDSIAKELEWIKGRLARCSGAP